MLLSREISRDLLVEKSINFNAVEEPVYCKSKSLSLTIKEFFIHSNRNSELAYKLNQTPESDTS